MVDGQSSETSILFEDLARVAPAGVVEAIVREFGGTRIYIPFQRFMKKSRPDQKSRRLVELLGGYEAAMDIIKKLNVSGRYGFKINIPSGDFSENAVFRARKSAALHDDLRSGDLSISQLAVKHRVSERTVYAHLARLREMGLALNRARKPG